MSLFDPVTFLNTEVEANATKRDPLPQGEVVAQITNIEIKDGLSGPNSKTPGKPWYRLDATLEITDPEYIAQYPGSAEKLTTRLGIMLDMTDEQQLAVGPNRNIRLGRLRAATGTNGKPLASMIGQYLRVQITHKPNPNDPESVIDEVTAFAQA